MNHFITVGLVLGALLCGCQSDSTAADGQVEATAAFHASAHAGNPVFPTGNGWVTLDTFPQTKAELRRDRSLNRQHAEQEAMDLTTRAAQEQDPAQQLLLLHQANEKLALALTFEAMVWSLDNDRCIMTRRDAANPSSPFAGNWRSKPLKHCGKNGEHYTIWGFFPDPMPPQFAARSTQVITDRATLYRATVEAFVGAWNQRTFEERRDGIGTSEAWKGIINYDPLTFEASLPAGW